MSKLEYSKQEIEAEHDYQTLHVECGQKLHGGFDLRRPLSITTDQAPMGRDQQLAQTA